MNRKRKALAVLTSLYLALAAGCLVYLGFFLFDTEVPRGQVLLYIFLSYPGLCILAFLLLGGYAMATGTRHPTTALSRARRVASSMVAGALVGICALGWALAAKDLPGTRVDPDRFLLPIFFGVWTLSAVGFSLWPPPAATRRAVWAIEARTVAGFAAATLIAGVVILRIAEQRWSFFHWGGFAISLGGLAMYWAAGVLLYSAWCPTDAGTLGVGSGKTRSPSTEVDHGS